MTPMFRKTYAEINLDALEHNVRVLRDDLPQGTFFCPMVKANAYGHGDIQISLALEALGVKHLGVCLIEEGLLLRKFGVKTEILVFRGFDKEGARQILRYGMTPVVSAWDQIEHLESLATHPIGIHLKFDTGMNRLGFAPHEAGQVFDRLWQNPKIRLQALVTHLAQGEDAQSEDGFTADQIRRMSTIAEHFKALGPSVHLLNSAGLVNLLHLRRQGGASPHHPLLRAPWGVRPGLAIYGSNPVSPGVGVDLQPVMSLKTQVGVFRHLKAGETVSYGGRWTAPKESVIAVAPIGYADGYHRVLSNRAEALFNGHRVPVVGSVCMDYLMLDVTAVPGSHEYLTGQGLADVVLFGPAERGGNLPAEELAAKAETIPWEIFTSVGERVPRVYRGRLQGVVHQGVGA